MLWPTLHISSFMAMGLFGSQVLLLPLQIVKVYIFGAAFRAEKSNTFRHLVELWIMKTITQAERERSQREMRMTVTNRILKGTVTNLILKGTVTNPVLKAFVKARKSRSYFKRFQVEFKRRRGT